MKIDKETGLTEQKKAITLPLRGKSITDTAKEIEVDRSTLYNWSQMENFIAYKNGLRKELQGELKDKCFHITIMH